MHDLDEVANLVRADDEVVYVDAGYQGVDERPEVVADEHLFGVHFRVAARKGKLAAMPARTGSTSPGRPGYAPR